MVGTLPIIFAAKTLGFRTILIAPTVEILKALLRFSRRKKCPVSKCLSRKNLAPRARFELATLRLTAECSTVELPGIR